MIFEKLLCVCPCRRVKPTRQGKEVALWVGLATGSMENVILGVVVNKPS